MRALVVYGSKRGGTEGIAETIADELTRQGVDADVRPAEAARSLDGYDGVVIGGALYATIWHKSARRFVRRHARELRDRPVWFFSSGPLDDSATESEIPPIKSVKRFMDRVGAQGHMTFGGRLAPDAEGFIAHSMAKEHAGDWRDEAQIRAWADAIAAALTRV